MSEPDREPRRRPGRKGKVASSYAAYHEELTEWLDAWERSQAELADQVRVVPRDLSAAVRGQLYSPWILERIRSVTDVAPPEDGRTLSDRAEMTYRYRSLLELLPRIEEKVRFKRGGDARLGREELIGDLRELRGRAADFADWLERSLGRDPGTGGDEGETTR